MSNIHTYFGIQARSGGKSVALIMLARQRLDANPDLGPIHCSQRLYDLAKSLNMNLDRILPIKRTNE